jgi:hypothetical protein
VANKRGGTISEFNFVDLAGSELLSDFFRSQ